jgi:hypothetical protein
LNHYEHLPTLENDFSLTINFQDVTDPAPFSAILKLTFGHISAMLKLAFLPRAITDYFDHDTDFLQSIQDIFS